MAKQDIVKDDAARETEKAERTEVRCLTPAVDIYENDDEVLLLADLPGVAPDAVNVEYETKELRIRGVLPPGEGVRFEYTRTFQVGTGIDPNRMTAELSHGVLRLTAKKSDVIRPRKIEVRAA